VTGTNDGLDHHMADRQHRKRGARRPSSDARERNNRRLRIGVVGAGRVGAVLGAAFGAAGYQTVAASGVSTASLERIARLLPEAQRVPTDEAPRDADLVLLAVPDDALAALVRGLVDAGAIRKGQIVVHTSGAHGLAVLAPAAAIGAVTLALHPAMTFTGHRRDLDRLAAGISFGVTAEPEHRPLATRLVADLGGAVEWIDEGQRPLYHAALAHGANHLVTLTNEALDRLRDAGVLHLDVLRRVAPDSVPAYLTLARRTADRAIAAGRLRPLDAEPLLGVLARRQSTVEIVP
jgi:predicted short-subunit dehydrogenase-like oxidoreductase (DUF2520 family)